MFAITAFLGVIILIPVFQRLAIRLGLVDVPGGRKRHEGTIPLIGGLVIFPVFMLLIAFQEPDWETYVWLFGALTLIIFVGALDDRFEIPPWIKFGAQFIAAFLIVIPGQAQILNLGDLFGFGPLWMGWVTLPFSVIATVLLINAINLMDGLDGLSGGKGFIIMFWFTVCGILTGHSQDLGFIMTLIGALGGFLVYNMRHPLRKQASIFMGDSGSMALGLIIAWFSIHLSQGSNASIKPIAVAWVLALPIFDTCGQFARRIGEGRHPFDADHNHFHHHFINEGLSVGRSTALILLIGFISGLIGVGSMAFGLPESVLTYSWIILLFLHIFMSIKPDRFRRIIRCLIRS